MTTETALKHLTWVGPLSLVILGWLLKQFRLYILARKAASTSPKPPDTEGEHTDTHTPEVLTGPAYVIAKSPETLRSEAIALAMTQALTRTGETVVLNLDNTTGAKPFTPSTDSEYTPPSLTIYDGPLLRDQDEENLRRRLYGHLDTPQVEVRGPGVRCYAMSPEEIDARILSFAAYKKRLDVEAVLVPNRLEELKTFARTKAQTEFLTPEKRAEIITESLHGRTREEAAVEGWSEDAAIAAWVNYVVATMVEMYSRTAMREIVDSRNGTLMFNPDGSAVDPDDLPPKKS